LTGHTTLHETRTATFHGFCHKEQVHSMPFTHTVDPQDQMNPTTCRVGDFILDKAGWGICYSCKRTNVDRWDPEYCAASLNYKYQKNFTRPRNIGSAEDHMGINCHCARRLVHQKSSPNMRKIPGSRCDGCFCQFARLLICPSSS
jgi:DNA-directed RNA polymerase subunit N (RpoN/RPB10)